MSGEVDAFGIFLPLALVTGVGAFAAMLVVRRLLMATNAYALVWHAGLFNVAMFVVLWWLIADATRMPPT